MKIVSISDTHKHHRKIEFTDDMLSSDVIVCAGDITSNGEPHVVEDFINWFAELPIPNKITIFGNHETGFADAISGKRLNFLEQCKDKGVHYLEDSSITIDSIVFYGSPFSKRFYDWEFNVSEGEASVQKWNQIVPSTNVLITHGPVYGVLDEAPRGVGGFENVGCKDLLNRVWELDNLKAHIFGHIHASSGIEDVYGMKFVNASICTERYQPLNPPRVITI